MFPLYNDLKRNSKDKPLSNYMVNKFLKEVKLCSDEEMEIIFALIYCHYVNTNTELNSYIPYKGKYVSKQNISFTFTELPVELQHILYSFIKQLNRKSKT